MSLVHLVAANALNRQCFKWALCTGLERLVRHGSTWRYANSGRLQHIFKHVSQTAADTQLVSRPHYSNGKGLCRWSDGQAGRL